jgi:hypothetical protein
MSVKNKVLAAAAALTMAGGLSTAGALSASAVTPQCSQGGTQTCIQIFSKAFGSYASPGFVETVFLGIPVAGVPTILHSANSTDPAEDLLSIGGLVSQFYAKGMVSAAVNAHYGTEKAAQIEYAPHGKPTGLCAALARTAYQGEGLTLQPCSRPGITVFIIDIADSPATAPAYFPIVNASTTDFIHPFAMTFAGKADPAHRLFPQIKIDHLTGNPAAVPDSQLWGAITSS